MHRKKLIVTFIAVAVCTVAYTQPQQDIEAMRKTAVQKQVVLGHKVKEERREQDVKAGVIQKRDANFSIFEMLKSAIKWKRLAVGDKMRRIDDYLKDFDWHGSFISGLVNKWRMALSDIKEPTTIEEAQEMLNDMFWVEESVSYVFDWLRTNKAKRDEAKSLGKIVTPVTEDELAKALRTKVTLDLARSYFDVEEWEKGIAELEKVLSWDSDNTEAKQLKRAAESHLVPTTKAVAILNEENRKAEEAARQKVVAEEAKRKAEEVERQKALAELARQKEEAERRRQETAAAKAEAEKEARKRRVAGERRE